MEIHQLNELLLIPSYMHINSLHFEQHKEISTSKRYSVKFTHRKISAFTFNQNHSCGNLSGRHFAFILFNHNYYFFLLISMKSNKIVILTAKSKFSS